MIVYTALAEAYHFHLFLGGASAKHKSGWNY